MSTELQPKTERCPPSPLKITLDLIEPNDDGWGIILWTNQERNYIPLTYLQMFAILELIRTYAAGEIYTSLSESSGGSRKYSHQIALRLRRAIDSRVPSVGRQIIRTVRPWRGYRISGISRITRSDGFIRSKALFGAGIIDPIIELLGPDGIKEFV